LGSHLWKTRNNKSALKCQKFFWEAYSEDWNIGVWNTSPSLRQTGTGGECLACMYDMI